MSSSARRLRQEPFDELSARMSSRARRLRQDPFDESSARMSHLMSAQLGVSEPPTLILVSRTSQIRRKRRYPPIQPLTNGSSMIPP